MKLNKLSIFGILMLLFVAACTEQSNLEPEGQWTLSTPTVTSPAASTEIVLNESSPQTEILFSWEAAQSSEGYGVFYALIIDSADAKDMNSPILEIQANNGGKDLKVSLTHKEIDEALSIAGYPASSTIALKWGVKAMSLSKSSIVSETISFKRFDSEIIPEQLFISGAATENGIDISQAIQLKRLNGADKSPSNKFEIYTMLLADKSFKFYSKQGMPAHQFGGADGTLTKNGSALSVAEEGVYRIALDLDANTYSLYKINQMGAIGGTFSTGWGGDQVLDYQGMGVWKASIDFVEEGGFIFRANGGWENILKRVVGTTSEIVAESDASSQGLEYEDIPDAGKGLKILTLDLSANSYTYSIEKDPSAPDVPDPIETPAQLFLLADGTMIHEFTKDGDAFSSDIFLALQTGIEYTLNSASDGSGRSFGIDTNLGADGDGTASVSANVLLLEEAKSFSVDFDQAFKMEFDFAVAGFKWIYYRMYLFHWDELGQKWDDRDEFEMTYTHPYSFSVSADLKANYDMKFNSPWDIELGSDDAAALSGNLINKGGSNIRNITADGSFNVSISVTNDFATGTYKFE